MKNIYDVANSKPVFPKKKMHKTTAMIEDETFKTSDLYEARYQEKIENISEHIINHDFYVPADYKKFLVEYLELIAFREQKNFVYYFSNQDKKQQDSWLYTPKAFVILPESISHVPANVDELISNITTIEREASLYFQSLNAKRRGETEHFEVQSFERVRNGLKKLQKFAQTEEEILAIEQAIAHHHYLDKSEIKVQKTTADTLLDIKDYIKNEYANFQSCRNAILEMKNQKANNDVDNDFIFGKILNSLQEQLQGINEFATKNREAKKEIAISTENHDIIKGMLRKNAHDIIIGRNGTPQDLVSLLGIMDSNYFYSNDLRNIALKYAHQETNPLLYATALDTPQGKTTKKQIMELSNMLEEHGRHDMKNNYLTLYPTSKTHLSDHAPEM